jgi:hypothetical protein
MAKVTIIPPATKAVVSIAAKIAYPNLDAYLEAFYTIF